jgi:radical SAM superfamily enzyme YgiQ (UPF0313 family)
MNVLLINPAFPDTFYSYKHALKFIRKQAALPPLGLLTVAAMLPRHWSKRLVDVNVTKLTEKDLAWADCAFISSMAIQRKSARQTIAHCKKAGLKIVAGGPLFTSEYEHFPEVDHFVLNEAELTLPPFLEDLARGSAKRIYHTANYCDLKQTPLPMYELIDMKRYATMSLQFSRGCPFNCEFCNVTALFGHQPRLKDAEQIINELNQLYKLGWRGGIFFVDDNFIGNKKYLKTSLLPALIQWQQQKKGIRFSTEASVNLADDEQLMNMMATAGFDMVFIGIETPDEVSLAECNDFIQKSGIVTAMVGLLNAPVGTKLYERMKKEGRLRGMISGDVDGTTNIIPKMGLNELYEGYKKIIGYIYSPKPYYQRVKTFLRNYDPPKLKSRINVQHIIAFFRSCIRLGLIGKERFQFWGLLFWTLFRRPGLFPLAMTLAIYGHHFRKICQMHIL